MLIKLNCDISAVSKNKFSEFRQNLIGLFAMLMPFVIKLSKEEINNSTIGNMLNILYLVTQFKNKAYEGLRKKYRDSLRHKSQFFIKIIIPITFMLGAIDTALATARTSQSVVSSTTNAGHWNPAGPLVSGDSIIFGGNHAITVDNSIVLDVIDTAANPTVGDITLGATSNVSIGSVGSSGGGGGVKIIRSGAGAYNTTLTSAGMIGNGGIMVNDYSKLTTYDFFNGGGKLTIANAMTLPTNFINSAATAGYIEILGGPVTFNGTFSTGPSILDTFDIINATGIVVNNGLYVDKLKLTSSDFTINGTAKVNTITMTGNNSVLTLNGPFANTITTNINFTGAGTNNQVDFGSGNTINGTSLNFSANSGTNNQVIFGNNNVITMSSNLSISATNDNNLTFGNNNTATIPTLTLNANTTNSNLVFGTNNLLNLATLFLGDDVNFTFPSDLTMKVDTLAISGDNSTIVFNNQFSNSTPLTISYIGANNTISLPSNKAYPFLLSTSFLNPNNELNFGSGNTITAATVNFAGAGANSHITFGDNNNITMAGTLTIESAHGTNVTFGNNNTATIGTLTLNGATSANLSFGTDNVLNLTTLNLTNNTNFTFPSDLTMKPTTIAPGGNNNTVVFNNKFSNTATTAININTSSNNIITISPQTATNSARINSVSISNTSANNTLSIGSANSIGDALSVTFTGTSNNNTVNLPPNRVYPSANITFSSNGAANKLIFGDDSTVNSATLAFSSNGINNEVIFGNNNNISISGTMTLVSTYGNKVTFGNGNTITIPTLALSGITGSNLGFGSSNSLTTTNLNLSGNTNFTFPSDLTMKPTTIATTGNNNTVVLNNKFNNTATTAMTVAGHSGNNITFGPQPAADSARLTSLIFSSSAANNTVSLASANSAADPLTLTFSNTSNNNTVNLPPNKTYTSTAMTFSSSGTNNKVFFGDNSTINNLGSLSFHSSAFATNSQAIFGNNNVIAAGTITLISGSKNHKVTFGDNNTFTGVMRLYSVTTPNHLAFGANNILNLSTMEFGGSDTITFPSDLLMKPTNISVVGGNNIVALNNKFDNTATTAMTIASNNGNNINFGVNTSADSIRLASLIISGTSANNNVSFASTNSISDPLTMTFSNSSNNNTVNLPPNRVYPTASVTFSSTGANNQLNFGSGSTINSLTALDFSSTGTNNMVTFGDNNNITMAGTLALTSTYGNKITFGNNNTATIGTLELNGITIANLAIGTNDILNLTNLNLTGTNNLTFSSDQTINTGSINFTGNTNNITFDNHFSNTVPTSITFIDSSNNTISFGGNAATNLAAMNISGTSSNNTINFMDNSTIGGVDLNFINEGNSNSIVFGNDNNINVTTLDFTSDTDSDVTFGNNTTIVSDSLTFSAVNDNQVIFGNDTTITTDDLNFSGISGKLKFGDGTIINAQNLVPSNNNTAVDVAFDADATVNVDNVGTVNSPISKIDIGTGEVNFTGSAVFVGNINFSDDGSFSALSPTLEFQNITTNLDMTGNLSLSNANILGDIGTSSNRLKNINFIGGAGSKVRTACSFYAQQINLGLPEIELQHDLILDGEVVSDSTTYSIGTNKVYFDNAGASQVIGNPTINFKIDDNNHGGFIVRDGNLDMNSNSMNQLTLNFTDFVTTLPPVGSVGESYTILDSESPGNIDIPDNSKVQFNIIQQTPFTIWSYKDGIVTRKRLNQSEVAQVITTIISNQGGSQTSIDNAVLLSNPDNTGDASDLFAGFNAILIGGGNNSINFIREDGQEITITGSDELVRAIEALQPSVVEASEQISEVNDQMLSSLTSRLKSLNIPTFTLVQSEENSGVSAGDDTYKYGLWTSVLYNNVAQGIKNGQPGFKSSTIGAILGMDSLISDDTTIGLAFSYADNNVKHTGYNNQDTSKVKSHSVSVYGEKILNDQWFIQGGVLFSRNHIANRERRFIINGTEIATSNYYVNSYGTTAMVGYNKLLLDKLLMTATFGGEYLSIDSSKYKERGTSNQNLLVEKKRDDKLDAVIGLSLAYSKVSENYSLIPEIHSNVTYDLLNKSPKVTVELDGLLNKRLVNKTTELSRIFYNLGAELSLLKGRTESSISCDFFFADKYFSRQLSLKTRLNF